MSSDAPGLFTRRATGLVREGRTRDALFYNLLWSSVGLTFAFFWLFAAFYPGASALLAFLIAAALGLPGAFLYAMLTQLMPRTGGDYVFNSRSLHPSIGFAGNFSYSFWLAVVIGVYTTYIASYGFGAFGRMMAGFGAGDGWLDFGDWFSTRHGLFITGTVVLLLSAAIFAFGGVRLFFKIQAVCFGLYLLGAIIVPVFVGLLTSHSTFVDNFNEYAAHLGVQDASAETRGVGDRAGLRPGRLQLRDDPQSGLDLLVHLRLHLLQQLLRGRDPAREADPHLLDAGRRAAGGAGAAVPRADLHARDRLRLLVHARLRRPERLRLRRRRAGLPGADRDRLRQPGDRRDRDHRLHDRPA